LKHCRRFAGFRYTWVIWVVTKSVCSRLTRPQPGLTKTHKKMETGSVNKQSRGMLQYPAPLLYSFGSNFMALSYTISE